MGVKIPPGPVIVTLVEFWFCLFILIFCQVYFMASFYLTVLATVLSSVFLYHSVLNPVDESVSTQAIYGDDSDRLPIYAHRGGAHDAPENTVAAIKEAKDNGADGVEFDMSFTKDNIAILFHDDTLERTTDGFGKLSDFTFEEIRKLDAASKHIYSDKFKGEKIPTLEESVEECLKLGLRIIFDIKEYDDRAVTVIKDMFKKYPDLYNSSLVASFFPNFIYQLRRIDPAITTALTWRPKFISYDHIPNGRPRYKSSWKMAIARVGDAILDWSFHNWLWYLTGVSAVLVHKDHLSLEYVRMWRERGIHVLCWTPNHPLEKDFFGKVLRVPLITDTLH